MGKTLWFLDVRPLPHYAVVPNFSSGALSLMPLFPIPHSLSLYPLPSVLSLSRATNPKAETDTHHTQRCCTMILHTISAIFNHQSTIETLVPSPTHHDQHSSTPSASFMSTQLPLSPD